MELEELKYTEDGRQIDFSGIVVNLDNTPLEDLKLNTYPIEIQELFMDFISNVPFIKNCISIDKPRACDMPKDEQGRIIINIGEVHHLENMDYFRPTAIHFQKTGKVTNLRPNANPNSEFGRWFKEEIRRCWEGYVRKEDGEWITGDMYFFLNYCPIMLSKIKQGSKKALRIWDFPELWEGHYYKFHYADLARANGLHGAELAARGRGKSYSLAAMIAKRFILGETIDTTREVKCIVTAYLKEYLNRDGVLNKFLSYVDFCALNTLFPSLKLKNSLNEMLWTMGYFDLDSLSRKGTLNEVLGVSSKDDDSKLRGKRSALIGIEEFGCHIAGTQVLMYDNTIKNVEDINNGDLLLGIDGTPRKVLCCHSGVDLMYKITLSNGDWQIVNSKHLIRYIRHDLNTDLDIEELKTPIELIKKNLNGYYIEKANINYLYKNVLIDPYFLGLWIGDGDSSRLDIANKDIEVLLWLSENYNGYIRNLKLSNTYKIYHISKKDELNLYFKIYKLYNNKHVPIDYIYNNSIVHLNFIAGLIDTDGTYVKTKHSDYFEITLRFDRKHILDVVKFMATNLGLKCSMSTRISSRKNKKPGVLYYRLRISGNINIIPTKIKRKLAYKREYKYKQRINCNYYTFKIEPYNIDRYYGFTIDKDHLFILKDGTIVHNSFPNLLGLYGTLRPGMEEGDFAFGLIWLQGTSGDKDSDFHAAETLMYLPVGYHLYPVKNVYDKIGQGRKNFVYFFPGFINRKGCYDKDGNSDVTKAILEILIERYTVKHNATDVNAIAKAISEIPITPLEAIIKADGSLFPIALLSERLNLIDNNPSEYDDVYVGSLVLESNGEVKYIPTNEVPIHIFPTKDNKLSGALEIFQMPEKDREGKIHPNRYIMAYDPVAADLADTMSLASVFVMDLFTDLIVAEYTGRLIYEDQNHEIVRLLCLFYNAKCMYENNIKGCYAYFARMNCLHLLADTPDYLRDKLLVKTVGWGNTNKGIRATKPINAFGDQLIKDWLLKPVPKVVTDEDGNPKEISMPNLYNLRNRALIEEMILYNPYINVDRIRALSSLMLYREEKMIIYQGNITGNDEEYDSTYLGNDDFFNRNYDKRQKFLKY